MEAFGAANVRRCPQPRSVKLWKRTCSWCVVWQLLLLLMEIVGGRLCPVEKVMNDCEEKKNTNSYSIHLGSLLIIKVCENVF